MISAEDVKNAFPGVARYGDPAIEHWTAVANGAIYAERLKDPRSMRQVQILFVMHHLERPPVVNLKAPHVVARTTLPGRRAANPKAPHVWSGTKHGERLIAAVKF